MIKQIFIRTFCIALLLAGLLTSCFSTNLIAVKEAPPTQNELTCDLPAPDNFQITSTTATTISTSWDAVPNASGYWITVENLATNTIVYDGPVGTTSYTMTNGNPATHYSFELRSVCQNGIPSTDYDYLEGTTDFIVITDVSPQIQGYPSEILNPNCVDIPIDDPRIYTVQYEDGDNFSKNFRVTFGIKDNEADDPLVSLDVNANDPGNNTEDLIFANEDYEFPTSTGAIFAQSTIYVLLSSTHQTKLKLTFVPLDGTTARMCWSPENNSGYVVKTTTSAPPPPPEDDKALSAPTLVPNPFSTTLGIYLDEPAPEGAWLRIYDLNGREVTAQAIEEGELSADINVAALTPGMYVARYESPLGIQTMKIIKQ